MQRVFAGHVIGRATKRLAVDGDVLAPLAADLLKPLPNAGGQCDWIEPGEAA